MSLKFTCPRCNGNEIEVIIIGSIYSRDVHINKEKHITYDNIFVMPAKIMEFKCKFCGYSLEGKNEIPINTEEELIQWLEEDPDN